eukprot:CAMPEP_0113402316 /NCGR_PEP_ID=MMETSP0013_2-20120614/17191_1 /TAXON_ID=2843 ORGANISM="Skeletonema costatum, Strain 1716" /NCGR_SAMPLE_ID=MMETSP0013_2 /ASSEMBLY_ACC=CAM_ASM_000158 /LENGTH=46 /DNA_ID=CAMNT_0000287643 /DNA_START=46 /DNA_END=183 /DNA_ORIENTATION=+ /assembly_acc=CAM_ASM_000158
MTSFQMSSFKSFPPFTPTVSLSECASQFKSSGVNLLTARKGKLLSS